MALSSPARSSRASFHRITAVGLYPVARTLRSHRGSYHHAGHFEARHKDNPPVDVCYDCTEIFERYQRSEKALVAALTEMYIQGVSTRKVKAISEELCGTVLARAR
jgi:hypothetical protein